MSLILAIETSSVCGSVALVTKGEIIGSQQYHLDRSHSSVLHPMIKDLMAEKGYDFSELKAIALSKGPGSYTGLRIGASAAKGLCYALDIPLIGINTLESMVFQLTKIRPGYDLYCAMLDARRMEVYALLMDAQMETVQETEPVILHESSYADQLESKNILFFGEGSGKFKEIMDHPNAHFVDEATPSAEDVAMMAQNEFDEGNFENVISFEPFYLKEYRIIPPKK